MGKTEKLVLLSVVLVLVVLFVWSLGGDGASAAEREEPRYGAVDTDGGRSGGGATMLDRDSLLVSELNGEGGANASDLSDGELGDLAIGRGGDLEPAPAPGTAPGPGPEGGAGPAEDDGSPAAPREVRMMPGWDIVTTVGLEATVDPEMLLFRPEADATWESLARDLYGKPALAELLRHNNEGMDTPGDVVFVPAKNELGPEGNVRYVQVLQGETLWAVAERTLGSGSRWKEIYEANRDVVPDPDFLAPGTVLTIPE